MEQTRWQIAAIPGQEGKRRKTFLLFPFLLFFWVFLLYAPTLLHPFFWDDTYLILEDPRLQKPEGILDAFNESHVYPQESITRPVRFVSFYLDHALWGFNPFGFHLTNVLLHVINSILVFFFANQVILALFPNKSFEYPHPELPALCAGMLFSTHPMAVESVAWVKNRSELFMVFFGLISLLAFCRTMENRENTTHVKWWLVSLVSYALAVFSKETALVLPFFAVLYFMICESETTFKKAWMKTFPLWLIFLPAFLFFFMHFHIYASPTPEGGFLSGAGHFGKTIYTYGKLIVFPCCPTLIRQAQSPGPTGYIFVIAGFLLFFLYPLMHGKQVKNGILFSFFWILLCLFPVANLVLVHKREIAEQRLYLPLVGFSLFLVMICIFLREKAGPRLFGKKAGVCFVILPVSAFFFYTSVSILRIREWKTPLVLWEKSVFRFPDNPWAHYYYGTALRFQGKTLQAEDHLKTAMQLDPGFGQASYQLGELYREKKEPEKAIDMYKKAIRNTPFFPGAYYSLAALYRQEGNTRKAEEILRHSAKHFPGSPYPYYHLGGLFLDMGKPEAAKELFKMVLEISPDMEGAWIFLGVANLQKQEFSMAESAFKRAKQIDPGDYRPWYYLGLSHALQGRAKMAEIFYLKSLALAPGERRTTLALKDLYEKTGREFPEK